MKTVASTYTNEENQPKPNFRQKVSSIPSKYETVLHRDANERNGFGNRTTRFGDCENELPGPGQYYKRSTFVRSTADSGSVSRLGYSTGFVSKSKRFSEQVKLVVPGPGQYQPDRMEHKPQNRKHGMSSFANTPTRSNNQSQGAAIPGPGDYNTTLESSAYAHNVARSVFSSKTQRGWGAPAELPAPGQYDNPIQIAQSLRNNQCPQSTFKSSVKRLGSNTTSTPGPGAYNAEDAESALRYDWVSKAHGSAAFHTGNIDRFGRVPGKMVTDGELGPGTYEVPTMVGKLSEKQGSASVFRSKTSRVEGTGGKIPKGTVPGPAFYHPTSPEKQSHLLNANKKWL
ncbi:hypothetical protein BBJ29_005645 [Phytophthora kernoviae]|uniref:Sperm-tail PG-rich repeat-containing protein 2 n=1 Tax=Phytophthora kernoviae TaxID=325452 RepID=A0A3R7IZ96_9STRA|nr:hypothetical protein BBJ29_005645 [Phytophthora kernoviae]